MAIGGQIRILAWTDTLESPRKKEVKTLLCLAEAGGNNAVVTRVSGTREHGEKLSHFLLVGTKAYRYEAPHKYFSDEDVDDFSPEIPARICFNDPVTATRLSEFFDELWNTVSQQ